MLIEKRTRPIRYDDVYASVTRYWLSCSPWFGVWRRLLLSEGCLGSIRLVFVRGTFAEASAVFVAALFVFVFWAAGFVSDDSGDWLS